MKKSLHLDSSGGILVAALFTILILLFNLFHCC